MKKINLIVKSLAVIAVVAVAVVASLKTLAESNKDRNIYNVPAKVVEDSADLARADVNGDGEVSIADVVCLVNIILSNEDTKVPEPVSAVLTGFTSDCDYSLGYSDVKIEMKTWPDVCALISEELDISAEAFTENYALSSSSVSDNKEYAIQYVKYGSDFMVATQNFGEIYRTVNENNETQLIMWDVTNDQAYNFFKTGAYSKTVYIRYQLKPGKSSKYNAIYIPFTWTPGSINISPVGEILDSNKISNYWYTAWSKNPGFSEFHINVRQPEAPGADVYNLALKVTDVFVCNRIEIENVNTDLFPDYVASNLDTKVYFDKDANNNATAIGTAKGVSGVEYKLTVSGDGTQLLAWKGNNFNVIATIDVNSSDYYNFLKVIYENNEFSRDIINYAGAQELGKGETLAAGLVVKTKNTRNGYDLTLENNKFNIRFLRPISISCQGDPSFVDAGQRLDMPIAQYFKFTDWRLYDFANNRCDPLFWNYYMIDYGRFTPTIQVGRYVNGVREVVSSGDITKFVTTTLNNGNLATTKLTDITKKLKLEYDAPVAFSLADCGTIHYENGGMTATTPFQIRIPFIVTYTWGDIQVYFDVTVNPGNYKTIRQK